MTYTHWAAAAAAAAAAANVHQIQISRSEVFTTLVHTSQTEDDPLRVFEMSGRTTRRRGASRQITETWTKFFESIRR